MARGRPKGFSGKYKDAQGTVIGVYEWRKQNKRKINSLTRFIEKFKALTGFNQEQTEQFMIQATQKHFKTLL
jgi:hypothetical protein